MRLKRLWGQQGQLKQPAKILRYPLLCLPRLRKRLNQSLAQAPDTCSQVLIFFISIYDRWFAQFHGKSAQMKLLAATTCVLGEILDHDPHFSHRFSRNPSYMGKTPTAYR